MTLVVFDGIFGQLSLETRECGVSVGLRVGLGSLVEGVEFGSWDVIKGELGLGGKPSAMSFGKNDKRDVRK
jgi:hypothetical protein